MRTSNGLASSTVFPMVQDVTPIDSVLLEQFRRMVVFEGCLSKIEQIAKGWCYIYPSPVKGTLRPLQTVKAYSEQLAQSICNLTSKRKSPLLNTIQQNHINYYTLSYNPITDVHPSRGEVVVSYFEAAYSVVILMPHQKPRRSFPSPAEPSQQQPPPPPPSSFSSLLLY